MHLSTRLTLAGQQTDRAYRSISTPIYQSAIYRFQGDGEKPEFDYSRSGNPTRNALEETLADLEGGAGAVALASGMAAVSTVLATLSAGAHVICSHDCYGGTERQLTWLSEQGKLDVSFVDLTAPGALERSIRPHTRLIWVETPSNPLLRITDLEAVGRVAKSAGVKLAVDNTFLSPLLQRPIAFGADYVVHSTTKYLNGHSDMVGGAIVSATGEDHELIAFASNTLGTTSAPFDSFLLLRGLKTLDLRLKKHEENAFVVAEYLSGHPAVETVWYPGLPDHEGHEIARRQQSGFGGMVSFAVRNESVDVRQVLTGTEVFALAESLGGVESLIEQPATMSHASMREEQRTRAGIANNVIRLSVGIEHADDLLEDLDRALSQSVGAGNAVRAVASEHVRPAIAADERGGTSVNDARVTLTSAGGVSIHD